jgi:DNA-binding MarR family transcriptional regulator
MGASELSAETQAIDAALDAANVMMRVAARSVVEVEDVVTTPQLRVLMLIAGSGPQNLGGVAAELGVHPSNATRTCEKLVQSGLIVRSDDPADRRFLQLELTADGSALVEQVLDHRRAAMAEVFALMSEDDRDRVAFAFRRFAEAAGGEPSHDGRFALNVEFGDASQARE